MIPVGAIVLGLVIGFLRGGRLGALGQLRLGGIWILFLGLLLQLLIFPSPLWSPAPIRHGVEFLHVASYAFTVAFLIWNRRVLWPVIPGMILNVLPIVANGGYMPASLDALRSSGRHEEAAALAASSDGTFGNVVVMGERTRLDFLGDWIYVPEWFPLATSFSIGDVLILAGIAWVIQAGMTLATGKAGSSSENDVAPDGSVPSGRRHEDRARQ